MKAPSSVSVHRALRFRAWDSDLGRFVEPEEIMEQVIPTIATEYGFELRSKFVLLQYTGLKDKNMVEIYEGDILLDDMNGLGIVRFGKLPLDKAGDCVCSYLAFYVECKGQIGRSPFYECTEIGDWMKVIGNIYEHPDLLKQG